MKQQTTAFSLPSEHRLKAYTVAATAAGVGALCSAPAAEAKVVYTPVHVKIVRNIGLVLFDVNHDGIADFGLSNTFVLTSRTHSFLRVAQLRQGNEIWGAYSSYSGSQVLCAAALPRGAKIGPKGQFQKDPSSGLPMAESNGRRGFRSVAKRKASLPPPSAVLACRVEWGGLCRGRRHNLRLRPELKNGKGPSCSTLVGTCTGAAVLS